MGALDVDPDCDSIIGAISWQTHDACTNEVPLDLMTDNPRHIDPRFCGVVKIEFGASNTVSMVEALVECAPDDYTGNCVAIPLGDSVMVEGDLALPDKNYCRVTLTGDVEDIFEVRPLGGDVNLDGHVGTTDASQVKLRFGRSVCPEDSDAAEPRFDVNCDGVINTTDFSQIKLRFSRTAPQCP